MTAPLNATMVVTVVVLFVMMGTSFLSPVPAQATPVPSISMGANPVIPNLNESMASPLTERGNLSYIKPIQATKDGFLIHNATNIVPCGDNPEMLCMNQTTMKVKPNAIRCKDDPSAICYPPQNYTRNYTATAPIITPLCTYDPVIVCTVPQIQNQNQTTRR
jgi:hypothetical protein